MAALAAGRMKTSWRWLAYRRAAAHQRKTLVCLAKMTAAKSRQAGNGEESENLFGQAAVPEKFRLN